MFDPVSKSLVSRERAVWAPPEGRRMTTTSHIQASGHRRLALVAALAAALGLMLAGGYGVTSANANRGVELATAAPFQPTPFVGCASGC